MGAEVVRTKNDDIAYWQSMTEDWIQENMEDEVATEKTTKSVKIVRGWRYIADGENAYIEMQGRLTPLTDKKQKRGKNARCHLMDLLSFPERIGSVLLKVVSFSVLTASTHDSRLDAGQESKVSVLSLQGSRMHHA